MLDIPPREQEQPAIFPVDCFRTALDLLTRAILSREAFIALTAENGLGKTTVLEAVIAGLADQPISFIRAGNLLNAPLKVERILFQIGCDEQIYPDQDSAERALEAMAQQCNGKKQVVLAIEEAETLETQTLSFLQSLPAIRTNGLPLLQILLVGQPSFWKLLDREIDETFHPMREQLATRALLERWSDEEAVR